MENLDRTVTEFVTVPMTKNVTYLQEIAVSVILGLLKRQCNKEPMYNNVTYLNNLKTKNSEMQSMYEKKMDNRKEYCELCYFGIHFPRYSLRQFYFFSFSFRINMRDLNIFSRNVNFFSFLVPLDRVCEFPILFVYFHKNQCDM